MGVFTSRALVLKPELWDHKFRTGGLEPYKGAWRALEASEHRTGNFLVDATAFQRATGCSDLELAVVFSVFDEGHARRRSSLTCLTGLALLCAASVAEKAGFLFDVFNFSKSGLISKVELVMLVSAVVRCLQAIEGQRAFGFITLAHVEESVDAWFAERGAGTHAVARRDFQRWCVGCARRSDKGRSAKSPARGTFPVPGRPLLGFLSDLRGQVGPYDDGNAEKRRMTSYFRSGDKVKVCLGGVGEWYKGTVACVNADGTVDVVYDEGDEDKNVRPRWVRHAAAPDAPAAATRTPKVRHVPGAHGRGVTRAPPAEGVTSPEKAPASVRGARRAETGEGVAPPSDSDADVLSADSDDDAPTEKSRIRRRRHEGGSPRRYGPDASPAYSVGTTVKVRYGGRGAWQPATVVGVNRDGTYNVRYGNGESDGGIVLEWIKPDGAREPDATEARAAPRRSPHKSVRFADEGAVARTATRAEPHVADVVAGSASKDSRAESPHRNTHGGAGGPATEDSKPEAKAGAKKPLWGFKEGDQVEASLGGTGRWYKGVVAAVYDDETYDIMYEDGDIDRRVVAMWVRERPGAAADAATKQRRRIPDKDIPLTIGDLVDARLSASGEYFKGTIVGVNGNGASFDIKFVGGDFEKGVRKDWVRPSLRMSRHKQFLRGEGPSGKQRADSASSQSDAEQAAAPAPRTPSTAGDKPAASAVAAAARPSGSASGPDAAAASAATEAAAATEPAETAAPTAAAPPIGEEAKETADSKDGGSGVHGRDLVQAPARSLRVGDAVQARLGGSGKWFAATVTAVRDSGRVDVEYPDGDEDSGLVPPGQVRLWEKPKLGMGSAAAAASRAPAAGDATGPREQDAGERADGALAVGDRVLAKLGGRGRWFAGRVSAVRGDGSVDVRYPDGDEDEALRPPDQVKRWHRSNVGTSSS